MRADLLKRIAADLTRNRNLYASEVIGWNEFSANQRYLWARVEQGERRIIGSDCDKRYMTVMGLIEKDMTC